LIVIEIESKDGICSLAYKT